MRPKPFLLALLALAAAVCPGPLPAETTEEKGLAIALRADRRAAGYGDYTAEGEMILRDRAGSESRRQFRVATLEVPADGDKSLIVFDWPADIRDTGLLTVGHKQGDDDQWLYLPAMKRVKRISAANRSGSFVGSEFAYEDMVGHEVERYDHLWLRDEPCPGAEELVCHVNERRPKLPGSGYNRHVIWLDMAEYRLFKADYYDRKDSLLKTLTISGYELYDGKWWRPGRMAMTNHQTGKSTDMLWREYRFGTGLRDEDFTTRALERAR